MAMLKQQYMIRLIMKR